MPVKRYLKHYVKKRKTDFDARLKILDLYKEIGISIDGAIGQDVLSALNFIVLCKGKIKFEKQIIRHVKESGLVI